MLCARAAVAVCTVAVSFGDSDEIQNKIKKDLESPSIGMSTPGTASVTNDFPNRMGNRAHSSKALFDAFSLYEQLSCPNCEITPAEMSRSFVAAWEKFLDGNSYVIEYAPEATRRRPITVGTDCSGMEIPILALQNLGIPHRHLFSCDSDVQVRTTIQANFQPEKMEHDITLLNMQDRPTVDLYVAGFPCQPFSSAGKREGFADKKGRGTVFFNIVDYIRTKLPKIFILENVKGFVTSNHGRCLRTVLTTLEEIQNNSANQLRLFDEIMRNNTAWSQHGVYKLMMSHQANDQTNQSTVCD